ncbi:MAG: hypothetical protein HFE77_00210 [Clostridiales bacterium]|nr:hypothetical protein [Clostridiales bacterium]
MKEIFTYTAHPDLRFVLIGFVVGISIACLIMLYQIRVPGRLIRTLIKAGADSPEKALRAQDLGFKSEWFMHFVLSERGAARKYVGIVPGPVIRKKGKEQIVMSKAEYYILPETKLRASMRYDAKNANAFTVIISILLFAAAAIILAYVIPDLLQMMKNVFKSA